MKILVDEGYKLHFRAIGGESEEVTNRQESRVAVEFNDPTAIDEDTETVDLNLKVSLTAENLAGSVTLSRLPETNTFAGYINLSTSILNALADGTKVGVQITWLLGGKLQRSDQTKLTIRQSLTTGEEGAPEADQSRADQADWLATNILGDGETIEVTSDPLTGKITLTVIGGGASEVDWVDITGKPTEFAPSAHTHNIYVRGSLTADSAAIRVYSADGSTTLGYLPLVAEWPGES